MSTFFKIVKLSGQDVRLRCVTFTAWKVSKYRVFSVPCFPIFGLNMDIYFVNIRIQSEYSKTGTRKNSVFGHFSRSDWYLVLFKTSWRGIVMKPKILIALCNIFNENKSLKFPIKTLWVKSSGNAINKKFWKVFKCNLILMVDWGWSAVCFI